MTSFNLSEPLPPPPRKGRPKKGVVLTEEDRRLAKERKLEMCRRYYYEKKERMKLLPPVIVKEVVPSETDSLIHIIIAKSQNDSALMEKILSAIGDTPSSVINVSDVKK